MDAFVEACRAALGEPQPMLAVKDVVERAVGDAAAVGAAVQGQPGVELLHRSDDLTVASVVIPSGLPYSLPHDHRMWAVVGVYGGQEDNQFYLRAARGLDERGGRSVRQGEVVALGSETIHAIC